MTFAKVIFLINFEVWLNDKIEVSLCAAHTEWIEWVLYFSGVANIWLSGKNRSWNWTEWESRNLLEIAQRCVKSRSDKKSMKAEKMETNLPLATTKEGLTHPRHRPEAQNQPNPDQKRWNIRQNNFCWKNQQKFWCNVFTKNIVPNNNDRDQW